MIACSSLHPSFCQFIPFTFHSIFLSRLPLLPIIHPPTTTPTHTCIPLLDHWEHWEGWGKATDSWMCLPHFFFSFLVSQNVCDNSLASLGGKNKARVFVRSGCGRLGNGGNHYPPLRRKPVSSICLIYYFFSLN